MASLSPSQTTPEFLNQYNGRPVIITAIVFMVLDSVFVMLRFLARRLQTATFGWDDWLIIPGWLFILAMISVLLGKFRPVVATRERGQTLTVEV